MAVEPAQLVLGLLAADEEGQVSAGVLSRAAALFGFAPGTIRVTLTRLKQRSAIIAVERGVYRLGSDQAATRSEVRDWRKRSQTVTDWPGDWLVLSTAGVSKSDRSVARRQTRAMLRLGFAQAASHLEIRANNRKESLEATRQRLATAGITAPLFVGADLPSACVESALAIWQPLSLEQTYASLTHELETAEKQLPKMSIGPAAALAFDVGDRAIRAIVADPLLPARLVDVPARTHFFETMGRFDEVGRTLWKELLTEATA